MLGILFKRISFNSVTQIYMLWKTPESNPSIHSDKPSVPHMALLLNCTVLLFRGALRAFVLKSNLQ